MSIYQTLNAQGQKQNCDRTCTAPRMFEVFDMTTYIVANLVDHFSNKNESSIETYS